jgi:hypothetical protein
VKQTQREKAKVMYVHNVQFLPLCMPIPVIPCIDHCGVDRYLLVEHLGQYLGALTRPFRGFTCSGSKSSATADLELARDRKRSSAEEAGSRRQASHRFTSPYHLETRGPIGGLYITFMQLQAAIVVSIFIF